MRSPKVFISYSHDSLQHLKLVLALANRLRIHGVDVSLDQYETRPAQGWPQWCDEQLKPEHSDYVLLICTASYLRRIEGNVPADEGRGVFWEGSTIYYYLYQEKGNKRFIPIVFDSSDQKYIPPRLGVTTYYQITKFGFEDAGYEDLYRELTNQPAVKKPPLGGIVELPQDDVEILPSVLFRELRSTFPVEIQAPLEEGSEATEPETSAEAIRRRISKIQRSQLNKLIGMLISDDREEIGYVIIHAYVHVRRRLDVDILTKDDHIVAKLVHQLADSIPAKDDAPDVLRFAVMCHDDLRSLLRFNTIAEELDRWIQEVCHGSEWTLNGIRGGLPQREYGRIHLPAVEVGWSEAPGPALLAEAYVSCGNFRHRIGGEPATNDRHQAFTAILDSLKRHPVLASGCLNHAQAVVDIQHMHIPWEFRSDRPEELHHLPVAVRCRDNPFTDPRYCPIDQIELVHCVDAENLMDSWQKIRKHGIFVSSHFQAAEEGPCDKLKPAIERGTIGIWTRNAVCKDEKLKNELLTQRPDQVPRRVHDNRKLALAARQSLWREVVLLFDPNLPKFKFSHEEYGAEDQQVANHGLE